MDKIPEDAPAPRLCHLLKWEDFDGYGFNLHGEKSKPGQYIGKVDKDSPAEVAGLKNNDRIIEVNGTNISNENHKQVVQRIKAIPNETKLLVLDEKAEEYYKSKNIVVTGTMANVKYMKTPSTRTTVMEMANGTNGNNGDDEQQQHHHPQEPIVTVETNGEVHTDEKHHHQRNNSDEDRASHASDSGSSLASKNNSLDKPYRNGGVRTEDDMSSTGPSPTPPGSSASPSPTPLSKVNSFDKSSNSSLDLNMTVQEMRAKLAARKKVDAKSQKIDLRKKYEIIQTL